MIDLKTAEAIHAILIDRHGGSTGIRDLGSLEAALARPYATFDSLELYPSAVEKAAAIFESLIINHPFVDGNKRIAYVLMRMTLMLNGADLIATQQEKYDFVILASKGEIRIEEIKVWMNQHLTLK